MQPQVKDATAMDTDNRLLTCYYNIGIQETNQIQLVQEAEFLNTLCGTPPLPRFDVIQSTETMAYLQDIPKDGQSYEKHNQKITEESDDVGNGNNKENFDIMNSQDECENESIQRNELRSGTRNKRNNKTKRIHKDEKPHVCETCNKSFKRKHHLRVHLHIHRENKPFVCNVCLKTLTQSGNLRNHSYLHTGERPYKCEICCKSFIQKTCFLRHSKLQNCTSTKN